MSEQRLAGVLIAHSWNRDGTQLAVCPNNHEIHVYESAEGTSTFRRTAVLEEHRQMVSGIDWNTSGSFASCSHDGSAYVWSKAEERWMPELVFTRLKLAALCVRWSPCGKKFAIGSSEKRICVSYQEAGSKWWATKLMRRCHDSSVVAVAWHPAGTLLAATSTDGRCKVFNASVTGVDAESDGQLGSFGDVLIDVEAGSGWGHAVAWSPSGVQLAVSSHGSMLHFLDGGGSAPLSLENASMQRLSLEQQPFCCLGFLSDTALIGAGFDGQVFLFERDESGSWSYARALSSEPVLAFVTEAKKGQVSAEFSAKLAMFKSPMSKGKAPLRESVSADVASGHSNVIVDMQLFRDAEGLPTGRLSTAGWDGRVLTWNVDSKAMSLVDQHDKIKALHLS